MTKKLEGKRVARFEYGGLGFPVVLRMNVPLVKVRGAWTLDLDLNELSRRVLEALALGHARFTGNQVKFVRHSLRMTLERFAARFGVTHPAVVKWEQTRNETTGMTWAIEKDIRLEVLRSLSRVKPTKFMEAYSSLTEERAVKPEKVEVTIGD